MKNSYYIIDSLIDFLISLSVRWVVSSSSYMEKSVALIVMDRTKSTMEGEKEHERERESESEREREREREREGGKG